MRSFSFVGSSYERRLRVEALEDRMMLAVLTVQNDLDGTLNDLAGDGQLSLREAVAIANNPGSVIDGFSSSDTLDTLEFDSSFFNSSRSITLNAGELEVTQDLIINGPGQALLTIDAIGNDPTPDQHIGDGSRAFSIPSSASPGAELTLTDVTLRGGDVADEGGAILTYRSLSLNQVTITDNAATNGGGIAAMSGILDVHQSTIKDNWSNSSAGAIFAFTDTATTITNSDISNNVSGFHGGGIYALRSNLLSIVDSVVHNNAVQGEGVGGGIAAIETPVQIESTAITSNLTTDGSGGGMFAADSSPDATLQISNSTISNNEIVDGGVGGGLAALRIPLLLDSNTITHNVSPWHGGGVFYEVNSPGQSADSLIENNTLQHNEAASGGGLYVDANRLNSTVTIEENLIQGNTATEEGGGVYVETSRTGVVNFIRNSVVHNTAIVGAGLSIHGQRFNNENREIVVADSTISENEATNHGGGLVIKLEGASLEMKHSTVAYNRVTGQSITASGGGVFLVQGTLDLDHVILADNSAGVSGIGDDAAMLTGTRIQPRYSLIRDPTGTDLVTTTGGVPDSEGNLIGSSIALLAPLSDYGGKLPVHALLQGSPAIDAGDPSFLAGMDGVPDYDMRGEPFSRVFDGDASRGARIDMGAFELQESPLASPLTVDIALDELDNDYGAGDLSLREALSLTNGSLGPHEIQFDPQLAGQNLVLILGELLISRGVEINGLGPDQLIIDASGNDPTPEIDDGLGTRVFNIDNASSSSLAEFEVVLNGLGISGGDSPSSGGAIRSTETLLLNDVRVFTNHAATGLGGGIYSSGPMSVRNSLIEDNKISEGSGGGVAALRAATLETTALQNNRVIGGSGGGLYVSTDSPVSVIESEIRGNVVDSSTANSNLPVGGAGIASYRAYLTVLNSLISENELISGSGGGILLYRGSGTLRDVKILDNVVSGGGAGIYYAPPGFTNESFELYIDRSTIQRNTGNGSGGGIAASAITTITNSDISYNVGGGNGGGVRSSENLTITGTTIGNNTVSGDGGGVFVQSGDLSVSDSTIHDNQSRFGGGIDLRFGSLQLSSSTISNNSTSGTTGAIRVSQPNFDDSVVIENTTMTRSSDDDSGPALFLTFFDGEDVIVRNSIIATNGFGPDIIESNSQGADYEINYSLIRDPGDFTFLGTGNSFHQDPLLGPLSNNGGTTPTHALMPGSPAINEGELAPTSPPNYDQRGFAFDRIVDGRIDMGAYESGATSADFDYDGDVDGLDFLVWQRGFDTSPVFHDDGDSKTDGVVDATDLAAWTASYGDVTLPLASDLLAVSTKPSALESGQMVDAAMAWKLLNVPVEDEVEAVVEQQTGDALSLASSPNVRVVATPQSRTAYRDAESSSETDETPDLWLSDELLDRVFG